MAITLKERPLFIIGSERSGTTLLMAMLGNHPRIAVPEVAWYYPRFRPYLFSYGDLSQSQNLRTLADEMVFGLKTPFWDMPVNPATIVDEILAGAPEASFAGIYTAMFERYARLQNKPRWGEKTPHNLFYVGQILEDFPNAQFVFLTRDGRDASAEYLRSAFGPTNIYAAARTWKLCQNAVQPWRGKLDADQWLDVSYEQLASDPYPVLQTVCDFLGEKFSSALLDFHQGTIAQRRGQTRDHAPLGEPVSTKWIDRYLRELSLEEQAIFAAIAGQELREAGYSVDIEPAAIEDNELNLYLERDQRTRAALLGAPDGHLVHESYNDWLIDQRLERKRLGLWSDRDVPAEFPHGHPQEEEIAGYRAERRWKEHFGVKRVYTSNEVVL